eukprot:gene7347-biopygen15080
MSPSAFPTFSPYFPHTLPTTLWEILALRWWRAVALRGVVVWRGVAWRGVACAPSGRNSCPHLVHVRSAYRKVPFLRFFFSAPGAAAHIHERCGGSLVRLQGLSEERGVRKEFAASTRAHPALEKHGRVSRR